MFHQVNFKKMYDQPNCIYGFCINLKTHSDFCHLLHKMLAFFNKDLATFIPVVTICTTSLTFRNCTLFPHCIYMFCIYLRTHSDFCHLLHKMLAFLTKI